jgi:hypothetical protein
MATEQNTHLEVLSAHYSETFSLLKSAVERRDRLFAYILAIILALLLYMRTPSAVGDWINQYLNKQAGQESPAEQTNPLPRQDYIDDSFIGVILGIGLLSLSHTYFQTVLHIERQYSYVYQLEKQLSSSFDDKAFIREGKHYREHRRKFSSWTKAIFWYFFPLLFLAFIAIWSYFVITNPYMYPIYKVANGGIIVVTLISLGYYLWALLKKE